MVTSEYPRIVIEGPTSQERTRWRVVLDQRTDGNGVVRETRIIELADINDKDAMGLQRWKQVTMKTGQSDWVLVAEAALNLIFERTT